MRAHICAHARADRHTYTGTRTHTSWSRPFLGRQKQHRGKTSIHRCADTEVFFFFFPVEFLKPVLHLRLQTAPHPHPAPGADQDRGKEAERQGRKEGTGRFIPHQVACTTLTWEGYCCLFTRDKTEAVRSDMPKSESCQEAKLRFQQKGKLSKW